MKNKTLYIAFVVGIGIATGVLATLSYEAGLSHGHEACSEICIQEHKKLSDMCIQKYRTALGM